jgi:hypothetical protein
MVLFESAESGPGSPVDQQETPVHESRNETIARALLSAFGVVNPVRKAAAFHRTLRLPRAVDAWSKTKAVPRWREPAGNAAERVLERNAGAERSAIHRDHRPCAFSLLRGVTQFRAGPWRDEKEPSPGWNP